MHSNDSEVAEPTAVAEQGKQTILVVDDHPLYRRGVVSLVNSEPDLEVGAEISTAAEALSHLRKHRCDAVLIDISLPGANGIELLKQIKAEHPELPVLVV